jgi:hypothetical protein
MAGLVASAGLAVGAGRAGAQAVWTNGTGNGLWHTPGNWSTNAVPDTGTTVSIPQGFPSVVAQGGADAQLTVADFGCFQTGFAVGCP